MKFDTIKSFRKWFVICQCVSRPRFMVIMKVSEIATSKKKGKIFVFGKECQLVSPCFAKLNHKNEQKCNTFWERICIHYNKSYPNSCAYRPMKLFKTKYGIIKHYILKFTINFGVVEALQEFDANNKNIQVRRP